MSVESLTFEVARTLGEAGVGYMMVGSFASNQYGIPRSTKDADFVIDVKGAAIESIYAPENLVSSIYLKLGIDPETILYSNTGRPVPWTWRTASAIAVHFASSVANTRVG